MEPSVSDMEMAPTDQAELHYIMTSSLLMEWCSECLTTLACGLWWMLTCALRKIWYLLLHAKSPTWLGGLKVQDFMARLHQNINKEVLQPSTETPFDFAYFAKLCTVATNISHYTGTEEYKQHSKEKTWEFFDWLFGTKNQSIMPAHEHRDTDRWCWEALELSDHDHPSSYWHLNMVDSKYW